MKHPAPVIQYDCALATKARSSTKAINSADIIRFQAQNELHPACPDTDNHGHLSIMSKTTPSPRVFMEEGRQHKDPSFMYKQTGIMKS